jgi:hypothetical protein
MKKKEYRVYSGLEQLLREFQTDVIDDLLGQGVSVSAESARTAAVFIYEGTETSRPVGFGERMSVIKSFYYAFDRFPESATDWQDIIKISAGRWPTQRNLEKEKEMKQIFEKIYLRQPDMSNANDNAMITIAAYGLRPQHPDPEKQNIAWHYYGLIIGGSKIFSDKWEYQKKWDIIRGIAYSGASR